MGNQLREKTALVAVALKFLHSRKDPIVHCVRNILLVSQVFFRGLNRGVPFDQTPLYAALPENHPAAGAEQLVLSDLAEDEWILSLLSG